MNLQYPKETFLFLNLGKANIKIKKNHADNLLLHKALRVSGAVTWKYLWLICQNKEKDSILNEPL